MYLLRRLGLVGLPLFLCFLFICPAHVGAEPVVAADAAILIESTTGRVIWEKNADAAYQPAP